MSSNLQKCGYKNDYPGPGSYLKFSEFGILVPKRDKRLNTATNKTKRTSRKISERRPEPLQTQ